MKGSNGTPGFLLRRWKLLILVALVLRASYVLYHAQVRESDKVIGRWAALTGDTESYLDPVDHLIENGTYTPDYRMPGVGVPYLALRTFLDKRDARDGLVVLQWLLSSVSAYVLALVALRWTGSDRIGLVVFALYLLSAYTAWHDAAIASDSLAASVLILQIWAFQAAMDKESRWLLVLAGLLLTWLVFLRPVSAAFVPLGALLIWWKWSRGRALAAAFMFVLPFAILDGAWTARNWKVNRQMNPLTNEGVMPLYVTDGRWWEVMKFIQCWGGDYIWWDPGSHMRWFGVWKGAGHMDDEGRKADPPPDYAYVPAYDRDSLQRVSDDIRLLGSGELTHQDSMALATSVTERLRRYSEEFKRGAPFRYQVMSRVRTLKNEVVQNGSETMVLHAFSSMPIPDKLWKLMQIALFQFSLFFGGIGMLCLPWLPGARGTVLRIWAPFCALFTILVYPFVFRMAEWRYMVVPFPVLLLVAVIAAAHLYRMIRHLRASRA